MEPCTEYLYSQYFGVQPLVIEFNLLVNNQRMRKKSKRAEKRRQRKELRKQTRKARKQRKKANRQYRKNAIKNEQNEDQQ